GMRALRSRPRSWVGCAQTVHLGLSNNEGDLSLTAENVIFAVSPTPVQRDAGGNTFPFPVPVEYSDLKAAQTQGKAYNALAKFLEVPWDQWQESFRTETAP